MRKGFSLIEVMIAAVIMATVMAGMTLYQTAAVKVNNKERDRAFAIQKAVQLMEEVLAYQITAASTGGAEGIDSLAQSDADYSFALTIDPKVRDVTSALSGNKRYQNGYRYVRQIRVEPIANERGARRVSVALFLGDGTATAKAAGQPLALVTNIVKGPVVRSQPTQVYDMYVIDIENSPAVWSDPNTFREILANTMDFLKSNNPGLEIRPHWVRRLGYGRDTYYKPIINQAKPITDLASNPLNHVYFYAGPISSTAMRFNPDVLGGQMRVDGTNKNAVVYDNRQTNLPEYQSNYTFADMFNHAVRQPLEVAKFANNPQHEISLRLLLDKMIAGELNNAIIVNIHAELIPVPPIRNYSDAASVPQLTGDKATIKDMWGVDANNADITEGSYARLVTHPRRLRVNTTSSGSAFSSANTVDLRVYPYKSRNHETEPADAYRRAIINVRQVKDALLEWNGDEEDSVEIQVMHRSVSNASTTPYPTGSYTWHRIWPTNGSSISGKAYAGDTLRSTYLADDPDFVGSTDASKDLRRGDLIIELKNIPFTHLPVQNGANRFGLASGMLLHGFNYFPDPLALDLDDNWPNTTGAPRNSARFRVLFKTHTAGRYDIVTTLGSEDSLARHQYPNRSETYQWVGIDPPASEQVQIVGDPRCVPYEETRSAGEYNRYFANFTNNNAYVAGLTGQTWNNFPHSGTWFQQNVDLPHYFELWRKALMGSNGLYVNPAGFSFYYMSLGGENVVGGISGKPYNGSTSAFSPGSPYVGEEDVVTRPSDNWVAVPWMGELYPDDEWGNWRLLGNLPSGTFVRKHASDVPSWLPGVASNTNFNKRMQAYGCSALFNGGAAGTSADVFCHLSRDAGISQLTNNGQAVATSFKMSLDSEFPSRRPFILTTTSFPPDWSSAISTALRTKLDWGLVSGELGYYQQSDNSSEISLAPIVMRRSFSGVQKAGYVVLNASAPTDDSGTTTVARTSVAAGLQAFFDLAAPTYKDGTQKGHNAIKLLPRVRITAPADDSQLPGNSANMTWEVNWQRWNTEPYSTLHTGYDASAYKPAMVYNVKYSTDGGASWRFAQNGEVTKPGVYGDGSRRITGTSYTLNLSSLPRRELQVRLEGFRDVDGYRDTHYVFHQVTYANVR